VYDLSLTFVSTKLEGVIVQLKSNEKYKFSLSSSTKVTLKGRVRGCNFKVEPQVDFLKMHL